MLPSIAKITKFGQTLNSVERTLRQMPDAKHFFFAWNMLLELLNLRF